MFARSRGHADMLGMPFMRCGDIHRVHARIVAQRFDRGMNAAGKILDKAMAGFLAWIAGGDQSHPCIGHKAGQHQGEGTPEACNTDTQCR